MNKSTQVVLHKLDDNGSLAMLNGVLYWRATQEETDAHVCTPEKDCHYTVYSPDDFMPRMLIKVG